MGRRGGVELRDYTIQVKNAMGDALRAFLEEAGGELEGKAAENTRVDTGSLKGDWTYEVDQNGRKVTVGNPQENAIWEEFGTGEHAEGGDGRKGGWVYKDATGEYHYTKGKTATHALEKAMNDVVPKLERYAREAFREELR